MRDDQTTEPNVHSHTEAFRGMRMVQRTETHVLFRCPSSWCGKEFLAPRCLGTMRDGGRCTIATTSEYCYHHRTPEAADPHDSVSA